MLVHASVGEFIGEMLRAAVYELAFPVTRGVPAGVCGLRKLIARGELGTVVGASDLFGMNQTAEWVEAQEEGRDGVFNIPSLPSGDSLLSRDRRVNWT